MGVWVVSELPSVSGDLVTPSNPGVDGNQTVTCHTLGWYCLGPTVDLDY